MLKFCGSSLFLALPDDVLALISRSLAPKDVCTLSLCCKTLKVLATSDKVWITQCEAIGVLGYEDVIEWRKGVSCFKSLCRFLFGIRPLIGIWVHQNPELGNVVYVIPGFVSVVGCRVIPQELGALGIEDSPLLWAPVFEVVGDSDGSMMFVLHGRENGVDYLYPGCIKSVDRSCNVLLLEVEPKKERCREGGSLWPRKTLAHCNSDKVFSRRINRSDSGISRSLRVAGLDNKSAMPFSRLAFGDRRKLLEVVTDQVRLKVPVLADGPMFCGFRADDWRILSKRRSVLIKMCKIGERCSDSERIHQSSLDPTQLELSKIRKCFDRPSSYRGSLNGDASQLHNTKRKTVAGYFKYSLKVILGRSVMVNDSCEISASGSSSSDKRYAQLHEFLRSGDTVGLTLHALTMRLSTYRAWPNMHDNRFALYKLPVRLSAAGHEYAGLWGGTFGWPPGRPTEDKPGKALFFVLLSYEESEGQQLLIATKILEGTHYVLHPNGSAMFVVKVGEISPDPFPWEADGKSLPVEVKHAYNGEGIANGYGFRYPGSKPGSLFVIQDGLLAFVWKESRAVLTLQKLDLQDLLKKGERVPALPPTMNFAYLTKSYSNVFTGFSNTTNCFSSPR